MVSSPGPVKSPLSIARVLPVPGAVTISTVPLPQLNAVMSAVSGSVGNPIMVWIVPLPILLAGGHAAFPSAWIC